MITGYQYWGGQSSLLYSFAPAVLHLLRPWEYWAHLWSTLLFFSFYIVFTNLIGLPVRLGTALLLLAPSLMSQALLGSPHVSAIFTLCIALPMVLRNAGKPLTPIAVISELALWSFLAALALNCYESCRVALLFPAIGAVTMRGVPIDRRVLWIAISLSSFFMVLWVVRGGTFNMHQVENLPALPENLLLTVWATAKWLLFSNYAESPLTFAAGFWAILTMKKHRLFWVASLLFLLSLYFALVISPGSSVESIRGRRHALLSFFLIAAVGVRLGEGLGPRQLFGFTIFLVVAAASAYYRAIDFYSKPLTTPVPYSRSAADFAVDRRTVRDARAIALAAAEPNSHHFIIYDFDYYPENSTDPIGLLERLQAKLGIQKYSERITPVLRSRQNDRVLSCHYSCARFLPLAALFKELERRHTIAEGSELLVYVLKSDLCIGGSRLDSCSSALTAEILSTPALRALPGDSPLAALEAFAVFRYAPGESNQVQDAPLDPA